MVSRLNEEFDQVPLQDMEELADLVQDLHENPPAPSEPASSSIVLASTVTSETVAETPIQPLLLAKCAVAGLAPTKARPQSSYCSHQVPETRVSLVGEAEASTEEETQVQLPVFSSADQEIPDGVQAPSPLPPIHQSSKGHSE